jgi:hypothetical protein
LKGGHIAGGTSLKGTVSPDFIGFL